MLFKEAMFLGKDSTLSRCIFSYNAHNRFFWWLLKLQYAKKPSIREESTAFLFKLLT